MNHRFLLAVIAFAAVACSSPRATIFANDDSAFFGTVRAGVKLAPGRISEAHNERPRDGLFIDLEATRTRGDDMRNVRPGETIQLEESSIAGPDSYELETELTQAAVTVRYSKEAGEMVRIEPFAGLSHFQAEVELVSGSVNDRASESSFGPTIGARLYVEPTEWVRVHLQLAYAFDIDLSDPADLQTSELGVSFNVGSEFEVSAGWKTWDYAIERGSSVSSRSDLDLEFAGPFVRLYFGI